MPRCSSPAATTRSAANWPARCTAANRNSLPTKIACCCLAIPLGGAGLPPVVATAAFVVRPLAPDEPLAGPAALLGVDEAKAAAWLRRQTFWSPEALLRLAAALQSQLAAESRAEQLHGEVEKLSHNLATTYEEICLLHGLTQNLRIQSDEEQFCSLVLNWLLDCLPIKAAAIQLLPVAKEGQITYKARTKSVLMTAGHCPLNNQQFTRLIEHLNLEAGCGPHVANRHVTSAADWPLPEVRQLVIVPMAEGDRVFGWLVDLQPHRATASSAPSRPAC